MSGSLVPGKTGLFQHTVWWRMHARHVPWLVLLLSLAVTYQLWKSAERNAVLVRQAEFDFRVRDVTDRIGQRMLHYEQVLHATRAFFINQHAVEHGEFRGYIAALNLDTRFPGMQGVSFAPLVPGTQKITHEQAVRKDGLPGYAIRPPGKRGSYAPVAYIEPFSSRNQRVLGFDNLSSPARQATLERARDLDRAIISEKLDLVQDDGEAAKAGFLMFLPVYQSGVAHATEAERRKHIAGWLGASFRMPDLMAGILGTDAKELDVEIYDEGEASVKNLMFDSDGRDIGALFNASAQAEIAGRHWLISVHSLPAFESALDRTKAYFVAVAGLLLSLLLAAFSALLVRDRTRAMQVAVNATNELQERRKLQDALQEAEQRWGLALEAAGHGVWDFDVRAGEVKYSDFYLSMLGYSRDEYPRSVDGWERLLHPDDLQRVRAANNANLDGTAQTFISEHRIKCKDGSWKWIISRGTVVERDGQGKPLRMIGTHTDISKRRAMEDALRMSQEQLRLFINNAPVRIAMYDVEMRYLACSALWAGVHGVGADSLIGRYNYEVHPDLPEKWRQAHRQALSGTTLKSDGEEWQRSDGSKIWVRWMITPWKDGRGKIGGIIIFSEDITERIHAEEALRDSEERYRSIFNNAQDFIFTLDSESRLTSATHFFSEATGYPQEEIIGAHISKFLTAKSLETAQRMMALKMQGISKVTQYEVEVLARDGRIIPVELNTCLIYKTGMLDGVQGIGRDITERRKHEQALRDSEAKYRGLFENMGDFAYSSNLDGNFTVVSGSLLEATGYSREELVDAPFAKLLTPDNLQLARQMSALKLSGENRTTRYELEITAKDGRQIPIEIVSELIYKNGKPDGVQGVGRDITQRKQAEEALRSSERSYRELMEQAADAIFVADHEGNKYLDVNKAACEMLGYTRDELLQLGPRSIIYAEDIKARPIRFAEMWAGRSIHSERQFQRKDGSVIWVELSARMLFDGRLQSVARDVTERRTREKALQNSERNYRELMEQASEAITIYDQNMRCVEVNRAALDMFGYSREEFLGSGMRDLVHPDDLAKLAHPDEQARFKLMMEGKVSVIGERRMRRKDGSYISVQISAKRLLDGRIMSVKRDVSEWRRREEVLTAANAKAEAASRAKSEFLANMSHEIRTPMNSVIGMARLAMHRESDPGQRKYLEKILLSGEHLLGIIDNILDFSKIDAGKLGLENVEVDIVRLMESLDGLVADRAGAKKLRYIVDIDPDISRNLRGDPLRLRQVLLNFADNAIKFTEHGEVAISVQKIEDSEKDCLINFEVRDTGIGMSQSELAGLFQSFQQADGSVTRKYGGTGLGLVISKRLVELMGGELGVISEPGKGSSFWFRLRLQHGDDNAPHADAMFTLELRTILNTIHGKKILLVENNLFNQQVAREFLENVGVVVVVANNGAEALDLLRQERFSAVLMDLQMPVMSGLEATVQIRATPDLAALPVIAMTANALKGERELCMKAGMSDFLTKPVRPETLYAVLAKWLSGAEQTHIPVVDTAAAAVAAEPAQLIDLVELEKMVGGGRSKAREFAGKFLAASRADMVKAEVALVQQDMQLLRELGHHLQSPAGMVGATAFAELSRKLENEQNNIEQAGEIVRQLHAILDRIEKKIHGVLP